MSEVFRTENDSLGSVEVPVARLWGAQTQRALEHFRIGTERLPPEMVRAYALIKKAAARVNHRSARLTDEQAHLVARACDELLEGRWDDEFPLSVWISGSGTQFHMNVNEVISNRCCQMAGTPLGSKSPVHPNDHVNTGQSTNDTFPSAVYMATVQALRGRLVPQVRRLRDGLETRATEWLDIVKIGRTHLQDATPLTLGQELSGYVGLLDEALEHLGHVEGPLCRLALGGTAVGTGINAPPGFGQEVTGEIALLTGLPFVSAPNKFTVQGSHDALVMASGALKTLACTLYKVANDIRLLGSGPRCGLHELKLPENEPGSSIMPGKVNPTQCEAMTMVAVQVMALDVGVTFGGAGGHLEMNVYKPLLAYNLLTSIRLLADACASFTTHLVAGMVPDREQIAAWLRRSLMLVTAIAPLVGYDEAARAAHHALRRGLDLRDAVLGLGLLDAETFDRVVDPARMAWPDRAGEDSGAPTRSA